MVTEAFTVGRARSCGQSAPSILHYGTSTGKQAGQPIYQLLGGKSRDRVRTYNTCYDHLYDFNNVENNEAVKTGKGTPRQRPPSDEGMAL